jgi:C_GCAxxG_C_C family probable redox protein
MGGIDDSVFKAGSCLSGGVVGRGETCGAVTGGMMAIGNEVGRERLADIGQLRKARDIATELYLRFHEDVGHTICAEIHKLKFGRTYGCTTPR